MNAELETKPVKREQVSEEELTELQAKARTYALLNRPSPPF
jgi:hypothetical protein